MWKHEISGWCNIMVALGFKQSNCYFLLHLCKLLTRLSGNVRIVQFRSWRAKMLVRESKPAWNRGHESRRSVTQLQQDEVPWSAEVALGCVQQTQKAAEMPVGAWVARGLCLRATDAMAVPLKSLRSNSLVDQHQTWPWHISFGF